MTHWTHAGPGDHEGIIPIVVQEVIKDSAGTVVHQTDGLLDIVGSERMAFHFRVRCAADTSVRVTMPECISWYAAAVSMKGAFA